MKALLPVTVSQLVAALLASVGFWWKTRADRRDSERRYQALLARVHDEIQVVETFIRAYALLPASDEDMQAATSKARAHLTLAYSVFEDARAAWYNAQRSADTRIKPHWPLAIAAVILFLPTGIFALIFASAARKSAAIDDVNTAKSNARRVVIMFRVSTGVFLLALLLSAVA